MYVLSISYSLSYGYTQTDVVFYCLLVPLLQRANLDALADVWLVFNAEQLC